MVISKSVSGSDPQDNGMPVDPNTAAISDFNQAGAAAPVTSQDSTTTRQVVSPTTLPLDYQYNQKQMLANVSAAISSDIEDVKEADLLKDETFGFASKKMYRAFRGEDFTGTDEEATQYGIDLMRRVENNLIELGGFVEQTKNMSADDARIALYMMDMFEAKEYTGRGFVEALGYMGYDPTTYIGVGTLGWGFAGKEAAKVAAKQGIKSTLQKLAFSSAGQGAIEGGVYTTLFEHGRQKVSEAAGEGYDTGSVGLNAIMGTSLGGAAGKYIPEIFDYAGDKVAKWAKGDRFKDAVQKAADEGDEDALRVLDDMSMLDRWAGQFMAETEEDMARMAGGGLPPKEYRISHSAPVEEGKNAGFDMSDVYPDDVYSDKGMQYYGSGREFKKADAESLKAMKDMRGNPEAEVTIYRAVPEWVDEFNDGDWVTLSKEYADVHGSSWVEDGNYNVIEKKVKAKDIFTNGDSLNEWGYSPKEIETTSITDNGKSVVDINSKFGKMGEMKLSREGNIINVDDIEVTRSGTGEGSKALTDLMRKADEEGLIITLTSDAMRGKVGQKKNRALYKKLGFIKNSGKDKIKDTKEEFYYIGNSSKGEKDAK